jgi:hypothetical protein
LSAKFGFGPFFRCGPEPELSGDRFMFIGFLLLTRRGAVLFGLTLTEGNPLFDDPNLK